MDNNGRIRMHDLITMLEFDLFDKYNSTQMKSLGNIRSPGMPFTLLIKKSSIKRVAGLTYHKNQNQMSYVPSSINPFFRSTEHRNSTTFLYCLSQYLMSNK